MRTLIARKDFEFLVERLGLYGLCAALALTMSCVASNAANASVADVSPSRTSWSPPWAKELVIYEVATKGFTSPNGPESGTFESLRGKLSYLHDLGITAIWLSGYSRSDPHHFSNIWTQYACIAPDELDPSLGTPAEFKRLIDEAHQKGIRIILDVITHGVMSSSPLIIRHPEWFRGGSYRMVDYDWGGGHTDLDDWWVDIWTRAVLNYGVDGFRLDVNTSRPDLWSRIRQNAVQAGHPIVIFEETQPPIPNVDDFTQFDNALSDQNTGSLDPLLELNIPGFYDRKFARSGDCDLDIETKDGRHITGSTAGEGSLRLRLVGLTADVVSPRFRDLEQPDGIPDMEIDVQGVDRDAVSSMVLRRHARPESLSTFLEGTWSLDGATAMNLAVRPFEKGPEHSFKIFASTVRYGSSIQVSTHDHGQDTEHLLDKNPYTVKGSRALFGYSALFTPMIPIFMAGEEFDATFRPIPWMADGLYGEGAVGQSKWLYGSMLDWNEPTAAEHHAMLNDVKRMLEIRRQEENLLLPEVRGDIDPQLVAVPYTANIDCPVPYMRWKGGQAIVVMANRNTKADAILKIRIPIEKLVQDPAGKFSIRDLWSGTKERVVSAKELRYFGYVVKRDKSPGGGIGLLKITSVP